MEYEVIRGVIAIQPCDACDFGAITPRQKGFVDNER